MVPIHSNTKRIDLGEYLTSSFNMLVKTTVMQSSANCGWRVINWRMKRGLCDCCFLHNTYLSKYSVHNLMSRGLSQHPSGLESSYMYHGYHIQFSEDNPLENYLLLLLLLVVCAQKR
jgi:hypothetical protein